MIDAYVRRQLAPEDCAAFEEHYFQCEECFDEVELAEKLVQGVHYAVGAGLLDRVPEPEAKPRQWLFPAFAGATVIALLMATGLVLQIFMIQPQYVATVRQNLQREMAASRASEAAEARPAAETPEANVPVVILTASRSAGASNQLRLAAPDHRALLWIDVAPQPAGTKFGLTLSAPGAAGKSIHGLERNSNGALAVSLPTADLAPGAYDIKLFNEKSPQRLVAEYHLTVVQP